MISLHSTLIETYRLAMLPARTAHRWWMSSQSTVPVSVLFYHRVSDVNPNPWTISRRGFEQQIDWLMDNFDVISLAECQRRVRSENTRPAVAITFDDGYAENCEWAFPYLIERQIPTTYFVTLGNVLTQQPFEHDVRFGREVPVNTIEQIRALARAGIEIGGHSRTHPDLGSIECEERLVDEIVTATGELGKYIEQPINYVAFPFGQLKNLSPKLFQIAKAAGLQGVCSAYGGFNFIGHDAFHIKRIHGDPNFSRLRNWLQFDLKMLRVPDFDYQA